MIKEKRRVIVIAGMHRSGTSLAARIFQGFGVNIGNNLISANEENPLDNKYGYFEDVDFENFQSNALKERGYHFLNVPSGKIKLTDLEKKEARKILSEKKSDNKNVWGWKDPRTTLFLDFWNDNIQNVHFFFVFRHPLETWLSLAKRGGWLNMNPLDGFEAWKIYNQKILDFTRKNPEKSTIFHIKGMVHNPDHLKRIVSNYLDIDEDFDLNNFFDKKSLNDLVVPQWVNSYLHDLDSEMMNVYDELQEKASIGFNDSLGENSQKNKKLLEYFVKDISIIHSKLLESLDERKKQCIKEKCLIENVKDNYFFVKRTVKEKIKKNYHIDKNWLYKKEKSERYGKCEFDCLYDTKYENINKVFDRVLHIFFEECGGPRSAAGYMPGRKLCLNINKELSEDEVDKIIEYCRKNDVNRILFHDHSSFNVKIISFLRESIDNIKFFFLWHANSAQFCAEELKERLGELITLKKDGYFDDMASLKPGMFFVSECFNKKTLLNFPPKVNFNFSGTKKKNGSVLLPLRNLWRKNSYTNLYAISSIDEINTVYTGEKYSAIKNANFNFNLLKINKDDSLSSRDNLFAILKDGVDFSLNITLSECQPMTFLESLAYGTPCLIGQLRFGNELDDHPYKKLIEIKEEDDLEIIVNRINLLYSYINERPEEMSSMMNSFREELLNNANERLKEFLRI